MANLYLQVTRDAQIALNEFSSAFAEALALADPVGWARQFGLVNSSRAIRTTYPIPVSAAGYRERKGDDKMRSLYEKSLSMSPIEWHDGVQALARVIEAPDFIGWAGEPGRIAREAARLPNTIVSAMLAANPTLEFDGKALFASDHPINVFDVAGASFDNDSTTAAINSAFFSDIKTRFRKRVGANGKRLGLQVTHLLVPPDLEQAARDALENDMIVTAVRNQADSDNVGGAATNNRHKGTVEIVVGDELEDTDVFYALDGSAGVFPWIVQDGGAPEQIAYDKASDFYKDTGKLGLKYVLTMATAAALPHAIERITMV